MYRIGEFSKMSKTTIKTLRYYDEVGLLKPEATDRFTSYRLYTTKQLVKLHKIQSFRQIGLSIDEVKSIFSGSDVEALLRKRRDEVLAELRYSQEQLSRIEFILSGEEEKSMNYQTTMKEVPACIVYSKKLLVPSYDAYFQVIPPLNEAVSKRYPDLRRAVPEYCFIIYLDGEYKEKDISIEYCEAVEGMREDFDGICFKKMEAVTVVSVLHKGQYAGMPNAYAYAFKWVEENGYKVLESPRESYISGIWNKEKEEDWLTEVQIPVVKQK